ncbi:hypothetical protein CEXT_87011 [Caerostris extrusa]|uniref:Uncharacterized protein n=1 Tax=Caerostris extrusa TaxID=172846 RepID=A0AAV4Y783_CAEEX|nr:hypothetical protein CEXT_87011 [Caerostris extrusa]
MLFAFHCDNHLNQSSEFIGKVEYEHHFESQGLNTLMSDELMSAIQVKARYSRKPLVEHQKVPQTNSWGWFRFIGKISRR